LLQGFCEISAQGGEVAGGGLAFATDQDVIMSGLCTCGQFHTRDFPQTPFGAIARDRVADLLGACETDAGRIVITAIANLKDKTGRGDATRAGGGQKFASVFQNLDHHTPCTNDKTASSFPRAARHIIDSRVDLRAKLLATLRAAAVQNLAASFGGHACAEAVAPRADQVRRLKCALHRVSPLHLARMDAGRLSRSPVSMTPCAPCQRPDLRQM